MLDLTAIRSALAGQIQANISRDVNVYDGYVPTSPTPPCVIVMPAEDYVVYMHTLGEPLHQINLELWILTDAGPNTDGQRVVDEFLSSGHPNSILDAVAGDSTLAGTVEDITLIRADSRGRLAVGDGQTSLDWASITVVAYQT